MDTTTKAPPSQWARWQWPSGLGRWHAIAERGKAGVQLACGRLRNAPALTAPRPANDKCCPTCRNLDDLRLAYENRTDADKGEALVAVAAGAKKAALS